jgi:hypothetical protein
VIVYQPLRRRTLIARVERNVNSDSDSTWYTEVEA